MGQILLVLIRNTLKSTLETKVKQVNIMSESKYFTRISMAHMNDRSDRGVEKIENKLLT